MFIVILGHLTELPIIRLRKTTSGLLHRRAHTHAHAHAHKRAHKRTRTQTHTHTRARAQAHTQTDTAPLTSKTMLYYLDLDSYCRGVLLCSRCVKPPPGECEEDTNAA